MKIKGKEFIEFKLNGYLLRTGIPNSNFLVFSESFYIKRFKNKGYRYHLGKETKQSKETIYQINEGE
jgi:hypothetical protein